MKVENGYKRAIEIKIDKYHVFLYTEISYIYIYTHINIFVCVYYVTLPSFSFLIYKIDRIIYLL